MTLQELQAKYAGLVHRQSAKELKANPLFMKACRENEDFKQWVLSKKPTMATVRVHQAKFLGLAGSKAPSDVKSPVIEPDEPLFSGPEDEPADIPRAVQYYRDVEKLRDKLL
jgi:hypothetical protein